MKKKNNEKWLRFVLYFIVVILINIVSTTLFFRIDLTENKVYSLSPVSKKLVSTLEDPLTIKVFLSENLPQPYNNLEQQISDLLEEYSLEGNRNFNYSLYKLDQEGAAVDEKGRDLRTLAEDYRISPIQIQNIEQDEVKLQTAYMGMVIIQGDMVEVIPSLATESNLEYSITTTISGISRKSGTLQAMDDSIEVKLYLSPELFQLNEDIRQYAERLRSVINRLNKENFNKIRLTQINPATLSDEEISSYGLNTISLRSGSQDVPVESLAYASVVVQYGSESSTVNLLNKSLFGYSMIPAEDLEQPVNDIIDRIIGINQSVGYLSDHGTPSLFSNPYMQQPGPTLGNLNGLLSDTYNVKGVTLDDIPEDIKTLIIAGPKEPFSQWELFQLDQFIMKGGSVAFFLDAFRENMPTQQEQMYGSMPSYTPLSTGLEKLIKHYGVSLGSAYVMDEKCFIQRSRNASGGVQEMPVYFAPQISMDTINNDVSFMKNIKGIIMLNISPVEINLQDNPSISATTLFSSSDLSWQMKENINLYNPQAIFPPSGDERASSPLGVILEGAFFSYFDGLEIPEAPQSEEEPVGSVFTLKTEEIGDNQGFLSRSDSSRIFLLGSSAILGDNVIDKSGSSPNSMLIQNVVDYLNDREDYAIMRSKGQGFNPLVETEAGTKTFVKTFNIIFIPLLVILFGLIMWFVWVSRRKKIALVFKGGAGE